MNLGQIGSDSTVHVLGWTLVHFLWQGTAVGVIYALLRPWFGSGRPRYFLGLGVLAALALLPVATAIVMSRGGGAMVAGTSTSLVTISEAVGAGINGVRAERLLPLLVIAWALGVALLTGRALLHWHDLKRLMRQANPLPAWEDRLAALCCRFGISCRVRLLWSAQVGTPTMIGWLKPVILLPAGVALGFSASQLELILAHELGHIRRWDYVVNLVQVALETVLFYHPVVHWVSRDLRHEREICCDELVLRVTAGDPRVYARALAELEQVRGAMPLALAASGGVLLERVQRIAGVPATALAARPSSRLVPLLLTGFVVAAALAPQLLPGGVTQAVIQLASPWPMNQLIASVVVPLPAVADIAPAAALPPVTMPASVVSDALRAPPLPLPPGAYEHSEYAPTPTTTGISDIASTVPTLSNGNGRVIPAPAKPPTALKVIQPVYPEIALERGEQGTVVVEYAIDSSGDVRDIRVIQAEPPNLFDGAATQALVQWRYDPATVRPGARYQQAFVFSLDNPSPTPGNRTSEHSEAGFECRIITGSRICRRADSSIGYPRAASGAKMVSTH